MFKNVQNLFLEPQEIFELLSMINFCETTMFYTKLNKQELWEMNFCLVL